MLLSYDKDLPRELRDVFAASGLAHLIAISGSHIALLAVVIFFGTTALGLSRLLASIATVLLSAAFLALVEFPASGIRSVLMVAVVFWAYASGRRVQGARALLLAAAVMTATNPRLLLGDIGFQLSVLAMWGLLVLYPFLTLPFRARRDFFNLRTIILLTLAAEIATAPLVAYTFGRLSVVGLLTNIVAIPLFPLLLVAGLVTATLGAVPVAQALITPFSYGVATLFVRLGELAAEAPGARVPTGTVSPAVLLALYGGLLLVPAIFSPRTRRRFLAKSVAPPDGSHGVPTIPHTTVP
jgi:competence protein ComEC